MLKRGAVLNERDLGRDPLSLDELKELFRGYDPRDYLNPRNELYRRMKMKENPPAREETLRLMAREPNLIRRPLMIRGARRIAGFDEAAIEALLR